MATPEGWTSVRLADLGKWRGGGTPDKSVPAYWSGAIPWVSPKDMHTGPITDTQDHISEGAVAASATAVVPKSTVLLVTRSGVLRHTLPVAVAMRPMAINQDIKALQVGADVAPSFAYQLIVGRAPQILHKCAKVGTTVESIDFGALKDFDVLLPPLPEQRKIAAILSSVDETIEKTEAVIAQLQVVKKAMMQELLTRGMPGRHTRFKQTDLGEIPEGWEVTTVGAVGKVSYGLTVNRQRREAVLRAPYLTVANLQADGLVLDVVKDIGTLPGDADRYSCHYGDVLVVEGNANIARLGRAAIWRDEIPGALHQNHLIRVRLDGALATPEWLVHSLHAESGRSQIEAAAKTSSGLNTINSTVVANTMISRPSVEEQTAICSAISTLEGRLAAEVSVSTELRRTKASLSAALLSGDLRVTPDEAPE